MAYRNPNPVTHFEVSGQSNAEPASNNGVTLVAGSGVTLTTGSGSVTIAASGGGGSSDTFSIDHFGRFKWTNNNLMGHSTYTENSRYSLITTTLSGKVTYSDSTPNAPTFTASIVNSLLYIRSGIVAVDCTLDSFSVDGYMTETLASGTDPGNAKWSMWSAPAPTDGVDYDTLVTWTRVDSLTWSGTGTDDTYYKGSSTVSSGNAYNAGDWWALTVQPGGSDVYLGSSNNAFSMSSKWSVT